MDEIIQLAERLGKAIFGSPQAQRLREARKALREEKGTEQFLKDFQDQSEKIARLEAESKPVEIEDKHKLQDLHNKLVASETFKAFTAAQVDYVDLMRQVNEAIGNAMPATDQ